MRAVSSDGCLRLVYSDLGPCPVPALRDCSLEPTRAMGLHGVLPCSRTWRGMPTLLAKAFKYPSLTASLGRFSFRRLLKAFYPLLL